jgi:hypothetical protein
MNVLTSGESLYLQADQAWTDQSWTVDDLDFLFPAPKHCLKVLGLH